LKLEAIHVLTDVLVGRTGCRKRAQLYGPEDGLKVDADDNGVGGDSPADCLRYLVATKSRAVTQKKLRGL
jgi:hypothetical protein